MNTTPKRRGRPPKVKPLTSDQLISTLANSVYPKMYKKIDEILMCATDNTKPILEEAHEVIFGDREQTYGNPDKNLRVIAAFWSTYLECNVNYDDVCNMMVLMKVARLMNTPGHHDSLVDIAGYTALQDRVKHGR